MSRAEDTLGQQWYTMRAGFIGQLVELVDFNQITPANITVLMLYSMPSDC